jgi:hypothetical protein
VIDCTEITDDLFHFPRVGGLPQELNRFEVALKPLRGDAACKQDWDERVTVKALPENLANKVRRFALVSGAKGLPKICE